MRPRFNDMKKTIKRTLALLLLTVVFLQALPLSSNAAVYSYTWCREIINNAPLNPQKTGFKKLDARVESMIAGFKKDATTTFDLLQACYDWLVRNVTYDRSLVYYPYYDFASRTPCPLPFYAIYFAYEPLFEKEGVCDNFASAFAVMARAIGLDSYIKTGTMTWSAGTTGHTWCEIEIDGVSYLFDAQADNSIYASRGKENHWYFGRRASEMGNEYGYDQTKTDRLRAGTRSVYDECADSYCFVTYSIGGNGSVSIGARSESNAQMSDRSALWNSKDYSYKFSGWLATTGCASFGTSCTFSARPDSGATFLGWYVGNKLVSTDRSYTLTASGDVVVEALFSGDRFGDVQYGKWYYEPVYFCFERSLMSGTSTTRFSPNSVLSRAMAVTVMAKMVDVDAAEYGGSSFDDVAVGTWYAPYVEWAKSAGVTAGVTATEFKPSDPVTREQFAVFLNALARYKKYGYISNADISHFADASAVDAWASGAVKWASSLGIMAGDDRGYISPRSQVTRAQAAAMVMRFRTA